MANNQANARINAVLENICSDKTQWTFIKEPVGQCLNKTFRNCICSHRCNNMLAYQYETSYYILIGKCCAKTYFTFNARARNALAIHDHKATRYCEHCEKLIVRGIHMFEHSHYTCYIRHILLPKAEDALEKLDARNEHFTADYHSLNCVIEAMKNKLLKGAKSWAYNAKATINATTQKANRSLLTNQDLMGLNEELDLRINRINKENLLNTEILTSCGFRSMKYILSDNTRIGFICKDWANGFFDNATKDIIRQSIFI